MYIFTFKPILCYNYASIYWREAPIEVARRINMPVDLNKLLDDIMNGREEIVYYYLIGMWLITTSYNRNGYVIDMMVCKGKNWQEAVEEAREFKRSVLDIEEDEYIPLSIGKTVLEATKNTDYFKKLLWVEEVMPDDEKIKNSFNLVVEREKEDARNQ